MWLGDVVFVVSTRGWERNCRLGMKLPQRGEVLGEGVSLPMLTS